MINPQLGLLVVEDDNMVTTGTPYQARRTWGERLLSWPWRPWQRTKTVIPVVPDTRVLRMGNRIVCHPAMAEEVRRQIQSAE